MDEIVKLDIPLEHEIAPYFQPIVSLQTQQIIAYESLGRRMVNGQVHSLGAFFNNAEISDEQHLIIDRILRERAFAKLAQSSLTCQLFVNLKPSWIFTVFKNTGELPTLQLMDKFDLLASRIVIEITEEEFNGNLLELKEILDNYRTRGCSLAIDDIGSGFSCLDRIAIIQPQILKMDLTILKKSAKHEGYRALLRSFAIISSQMGASLLVEGVETKEDLQNALLAGARYAQGFLFAPALPDFLPADYFSEMVKEEVRLFHAKELAKYSRLFEAEQGLNDLFNSDAVITSADKADQVIEQFLPAALDNGIRVYICTEDGNQISSNYFRQANSLWSKDEKFRGANWSWRPYFIPNILTMRNRRIGILSQAYADLDTANLIQTYSCPLGSGFYLFIDLTI